MFITTNSGAAMMKQGEVETAPQSIPMSRADYLLSHLAQECCEIAIRCTKAQMFGLDEIQPGQEFTNRERIMHELCDLLATGETMRDEGVLPEYAPEERMEAKKVKAAKFSDYSRQLGRLEAATEPMEQKQ
jgi:hypothetical protein